MQQQQQQPQVQQQPQPPQAMAGPTDAADPKEELGLRIFQASLQGLYQQSMLAAGFTAQEASHSAQSFHRFAFQAWKSECERLQVLLKDNNVHSQQPNPTGV